MATDKLRRYGPLGVLAAAALVVAAVVVLGPGGDDAEPTGANRPDALGLDGRPGAPEPVGAMPGTYAEAEATGMVVDDDWGERCDPETGKLRVPSVYALPCVPVFAGDNGGATSDGVTEDTITVVHYAADPTMDVARVFAQAGTDTSPETILATHQDYVEILSAQAELYGRRIEVVQYQGTGQGNDVVAAKADAVQIATEIKPFAVISGPGLDRGTFAQELAARGILCINCSSPAPADILEPLAPYVWSTLPSSDQFVTAVQTWAGKAQENNAENPEDGEANYAGDPAYHERPRKVGVIHFEYDPPAWPTDVPENVHLMETYVLDFDTLPEKAAELMAKFKDEEITSVVFLGDPIAPTYLTSAATALDYGPEWIFTGTVYTDTNLFARRYDPEQMQHAYGISQQAAPLEQDLQDAIRLYRWYFGGEDTLPQARTNYAVYAAQVGLLVSGIHMAGPELTPETFARGLFRIPPMGGGPTAPQVSYGNWGFFDSPDYSGIDDFTEIWWDPSVVGPDESGQEGTGVWRRARGGERYVREEDMRPPDPFTDVADTVTVLDELPPEDTPPDYPPPPGSPAAAAG